jgi:hypothetical protein
MWATLALAAVLQQVPDQGGKLTISNVRNTYGLLGRERKDSEFLPGDLFVVSFDIEGLPIKDNGEVEYSMGVELKAKGGKSQFKTDPEDLKQFNGLGSTRLPASATTFIGADTPPGKYTFIVTVLDKSNKNNIVTKTLERDFEVLKITKPGIVGLVLTDRQMTPMPPLAVVGQTLMINFGLVGFDLDNNKDPNVGFEMSIVDENNKPTFKTPLTDTEKTTDPRSPKMIPRHYEIPLLRSGSFTVKIKAKDNISGKTTEADVPFKVLDLPK